MIKKNINSKFLRISCPRCNQKHVIFGKATSKIKCDKCGKLLIRPTGGKTKIKARIEEIL